MDTLHRTDVIAKLGETRFFPRVQFALDYAWDGLGPDYDRDACPLHNPVS